MEIDIDADQRQPALRRRSWQVPVKTPYGRAHRRIYLVPARGDPSKRRSTCYHRNTAGIRNHFVGDKNMVRHPLKAAVVIVALVVLSAANAFARCGGRGCGWGGYGYGGGWGYAGYGYGGYGYGAYGYGGYGYGGCGYPAGGYMPRSYPAPASQQMPAPSSAPLYPPASAPSSTPSSA